MTELRLYHYSAAPFALDPHRVYPQEPPERMPMKPAGLWLSVESDDEDSFGWRDWCERESFRVPELACMDPKERYCGACHVFIDDHKAHIVRLLNGRYLTTVTVALVEAAVTKGFASWAARAAECRTLPQWEQAQQLDQNQ